MKLRTNLNRELTHSYNLVETADAVHLFPFSMDPVNHERRGNKLSACPEEESQSTPPRG